MSGVGSENSFSSAHSAEFEEVLSDCPELKIMRKTFRKNSEDQAASRQEIESDFSEFS